VSTGSGCLLNLVYKPAAVGAGTLTLDYSFIDNGGAVQKATATINYVATTNNNVLATAAPAGQITAMVGHGSQAVAVTFTTDDGNPASALTLITDLATLPTGWAGTGTSFTCASVSTGNGCQLPLTYTPPAIASGTLSLNYSYKDNSGDAKVGTLALSYVGTNSDNVVGTVAPSGQVVSVLGSGTQAVTVTFTTDDGNAATAMSLTSPLSALPGGWTSSASGLTCATVSTGNGCQFPLSFAPVTVGSGTVALTYSYTDVGGHAKTGTVNIPYAGTVHDNVVGTTSPSGQINAVVGGGTQTVLLTFNTDDGNLASGFSITTNLSGLPAGWSSSAHTLTCTQASSGNTCQLTLTYAPTAAASGTLTVQYSYVDNAGAAKTGVVSIPYAATVHDNVVGTASPSGQIVGAIGDAAHPVNVTFTTDDGNPATALSVTSATLSTLPLGWSASAGSLTCSSVSTGAGCQLGLTFTPAATATGTLSLPYAYTDNAGTSKNGNVSIAYASTSHNSVVGAISPAGVIRVRIGDSQQFPVTFTTNDGNTASGFSITSDLATLPAGWSGSGTGFTCSAVNVGTLCVLPLTYAPIVNGSGTLTINYSYTDSAFTAKTGSVSFPYSNPNVYAISSPGVYQCPILADGTLGSCVITGNTLYGSYSTDAFNGDYVYSPESFGSTHGVSICHVEINGTFTACADSGITSFPSPNAAWAYGGYVYVTDYGTDVQVCMVGVSGALTGCAPTATAVGTAAFALTVGPQFAYVITEGTPGAFVCTVSSSDGTLTGCVSTGGNAMNQASSIRVEGVHSYAAGSGGHTIVICTLSGTDGSMSGCTTNNVGLSGISDIAVYHTDAFIVAAGGNSHNAIFHCTLNESTGVISNCVAAGGGLSNWNGYSVVIE
jgi:hypothetical protein